MGAESSKTAHTNRRSLFDANESTQIDRLFAKISENASEGFNIKQFKQYLPLADDLSVKLYNYMKCVASEADDVHKRKKAHKDELITRTDFEFSLARILKGGVEEKARLLQFLVSDGQVGHFKQLLSLFLRFAETSLGSTEEYLSWKFQKKANEHPFVDHFVFDLVVRDGRQQCDAGDDLLSTEKKTFDQDDIEQWLRRNPTVQLMINYAFFHCFPIGDITRFNNPLPCCGVDASHASAFSVLDLSSVIFINSVLPHSLRSEWRLLFSTVLHGISFATMLKRIMNEGPTILVIKDRGGHIFGGFAAESWTPNANFYGSSQCFLFSLFPVMDVFLPTGYNSHFMYINQNQQTLPNGLGMGGQWNYAGLWIDQEYGQGHSKAKPKCTTYNSPQLSSEPEFSFDVMEVWAVGRKPSNPVDEENTDEVSPKKKSGLLQMDAETKALMEMIGKKQHSEAFREEDGTLLN